MLFDDEREAFREYARALPDDCVLLVDTYDTLEGVRKAVEVGHWLRQQGHELGGVRLDSGDLAYLSIEARKLLDAGGFPEARILASNDLDEHLIESLKEQGARITHWGVGTKLATAWDQPALGGVYKLSAARRPGGAWEPKLKLSEQAVKISTPGVLQVRRFALGGGGPYQADAIFDEVAGIGAACTIVDPVDPTRRKRLPEGTPAEDLLVPVFRGGRNVYELPPLEASRQRTSDQLARFHAGIKRFANPHRYPVGLERSLFDLKTRLIMKARRVPE
jgi:nicotinate phosphoribosyltransferase